MFYLPVFTETEYGALKRVMQSQLPETYEGWLDLASEWADKHSREGVAKIQIRVVEFAEFMTNAGRELDIQALLDFSAFNPWHDPD